ncbi:MAG: thiolase family protein [Synergistaceae bacterium]|jgi:acetyl-CoA C-acetyltransferase|nr:thiolase family protein [Synergistaceae bacterium]
MREVVVVEAVRTAVGKLGGALKDVQAEELASIVINGLVDKTGIDTSTVDEVIFGQVRQSSEASNLARIAALRSGIPEEVPAYTVMRQCASGLQAVNNGCQAILSGDAEVIIAGGTESMSNAVFYLRNARYGLGTGNSVLVDSLTEGQVRSQPQDIYGTFNMGITAENVAERCGISREAQDLFSHGSQKKADDAIKNGRFDDEIVPVIIPQKKGEAVIFKQDEFPRLTTIEKLASLKPAFKENGSVTAGNSSGRNDGATALLLMSSDKAYSLGLKPLAIIKGAVAAGVSPKVMGLGPVFAVEKLLKKLDLKLDDIDLIELNEAFAAQSLGCIQMLKLDQSKINVNGGAIALGHPVGSSGARILVTLIHELRRRKQKYGLATLCVAGGMGVADLVEAVY